MRVARGEFALPEDKKCKTDIAGLILEQIRFAEKYCDANSLQLTPVRRKVLELLLQSKGAIGAYDILDHLRQAGFKSQPPVAYRALEFLLKYGFAHKVEQLNAFVACTHPGEEHSPAFMICRNCDSVSEMETDGSEFPLSGVTNFSGFKIEEAIIEAKGLCNVCADVDLK